jgi:hypothetical protein
MFVEHTCPPGQSSHPADAENAFLLSKVKPNTIVFVLETLE